MIFWTNPCKWAKAPARLLRPATSSSRLAPGCPGATYLQALCGRLPHLPALGFGRGDAGETQLMRLGARGCGSALHLGSVSQGCASRSRPRPRGGRRGLGAGGGGTGLSCRQLVGTAARRLSWRSSEKTAQLRPGRERTAAAATAPSPSPAATEPRSCAL